MNRFLIIADDFTGANDTGVQLRKRGIKTDVIFNSLSIDEKKEKSYVIDTESRGLSNEDAFKDVEKKAKDAFKYDFQYVYKKVDSTLRGNIVSEVKAVDKYYNAELIIFAPAYPDSKRTTIDAVQQVNGVKITETEIAKDPIKPVKVDNIHHLLKEGFDEEVKHVYLKEIRENTMNFSEGRIFTFDAETNEDLIKIAREVFSYNKKVLWIGSAGLADCILKVQMPISPALVVVGSISEVSNKQLHYAVKQGAKLVSVDIGKILKGDNEIEIIEEVVDKINNGSDVIIASSTNREEYEEAIKVGEEIGYNKQYVSEFTQSVLGGIVDRVLQKSSVSGLFLTGGDTAIGIINKLGAKGSSISQEIMTGIPLMNLNGGKYDGLKVITKAGAFGEINALDYSIKKLKEDI